MCFPGRGAHISGDMCFPGRGTHITRDMCFPGRGTHITRDMCFLGRGAHIARDMCFLGRGAYITRDMCFPGRGHLSLGTNVCVAQVGGHISLGIQNVRCFLHSGYKRHKLTRSYTPLHELYVDINPEDFTLSL